MKEKTDLDAYVGILSKESADALEKAIKESRKRHRKSRALRIARITKELSESY